MKAIEKSKILINKFKENENYKLILKLTKLDGHKYMPSSLTFYLVLSLIPLLSIFVLVLSLLGVPAKIISENINIILPTNEEIIEKIISYLEDVNFSSIFTLSFSSLISIYVASKGIENFALFSDKFYKYSSFDNKFVRRKIRSILLTLALVLFVDFLVGMFFFFEMITSSFIPIVVSSWLKFPLFLIAFFITITIIFMFVPSKKQKFKDIYPGSYFASISITFLLFSFNIYVKYFANYTNVYGPISSIIILLLIIFFSSYLLFISVYLNVLIKEEEENKKYEQQIEQSKNKIRIVNNLY